MKLESRNLKPYTCCLMSDSLSKNIGVIGAGFGSVSDSTVTFAVTVERRPKLVWM